MPEDRKRFYCGDSDGFVHRVNLRSPEAYLKFHSVLPRVYHMATANSTIAVNDGNLRGNYMGFALLYLVPFQISGGTRAFLNEMCGSGVSRALVFSKNGKFCRLF